MQAKMFIPAHAKPTEDIQELVQYNISKVNENAEFLIALCEKPMNYFKTKDQTKESISSSVFKYTQPFRSKYASIPHLVVISTHAFFHIDYKESFSARLI